MDDERISMKFDLFEKSLDEIEEAQRNATIMLEARKNLIKLAKFISEAGGAMDAEKIAKTTLEELAICGAHNQFRIELVSDRPYLKLPKNLLEDVEEDVIVDSDSSGIYAPGTK